MSWSTNQIRSEFPALQDSEQPRKIFLDNPAGTQVPKSVVASITKCLTETNANVGGHFQTSQAITTLIEEARTAVKDFVNARSKSEIIFGPNMTSLTHMLAQTLFTRLRSDDEIILGEMDHDANIAPWLFEASKIGCTIKWLKVNPETFEYNPEELDSLLSSKTRLVALNHASNLTGTINDVQLLTKKAKDAGALVFVDSVQFAPHGLIDVAAIDCDFLCCSAYKFYGPHQGVLWGRSHLLESMSPFKVRPAPDDIPRRFEAGTMNHECIVGTMAAIDYLASVFQIASGANCVDASAAPFATGRRARLRRSMDSIRNHELALTKDLIAGLKKLSGVTIHGISDEIRFAQRVPTVSFSHSSINSRKIAELLAVQGIFVWNGHNYAVELARRLNLGDGGAVRIGLAHYNTTEEVATTLNALENLVSAGDTAT